MPKSGQTPVRVLKHPISIPISKQEFTPEYSDELIFQTRALTHKKSLTQTNMQKSSTRPSSIKTTETPQGSKDTKQSFAKPQSLMAKPEIGEKMPLMAHEEKINANDCFYVDMPVPNFMDESSSLLMNTGPQRQAQKGKAMPTAKMIRASSITTISSQNTLPEEERKRDDFSRRGEIPQIGNPTKGGTAPVKSFKTIDKISETKAKAMRISDQVIRQHRFNQDDEDEEADFKTMYDALNTKL